jgi:hypothetical protein
MKKLLLTVLSLTAMTSYAALPSGNPYVGLQMGYGQIQTPSVNLNGLTTGGFAYRIFGGYDMMVTDAFHIGPEIGYAGYPDNNYALNVPGASISTTTYSSSYIDALMVGKYYFINGLNMVGKAGFALLNQQVSLYGVSESESTITPEMGIGFGYDFNNMFGFNLTYNHVFGDNLKPTDVTSGNADKFAPVDTYLVAITYTFD